MQILAKLKVIQNVFIYGMNSRNFVKAKEQIMQPVKGSAPVVEGNGNQQETR